MSEPKLTEALAEALREADEYGYGLRDRDLPRQLGFVIAPIIAAAEETARAEAWDTVESLALKWEQRYGDDSIDREIAELRALKATS